MRTHFRLPPGYVKRPAAAEMLGISEWKFVHEWRKRGWKEEVFMDLFAYKLSDVEALGIEIEKERQANERRRRERARART